MRARTRTHTYMYNILSTRVQHILNIHVHNYYTITCSKQPVFAQLSVFLYASTQTIDSAPYAWLYFDVLEAVVDYREKRIPAKL
jgi:hypothetical protein